MVSAADAARIVGFIVNRFRGDPALFADGMTEIARLTGWHDFGLLPFFADAGKLPAEDALALSYGNNTGRKGGRVKVAVPILPHISNFDDLDPLEAEPDVELCSRAAGRGAAGRCGSRAAGRTPRRRSPI